MHVLLFKHNNRSSHKNLPSKIPSLNIFFFVAAPTTEAAVETWANSLADKHEKPDQTHLQFTCAQTAATNSLADKHEKPDQTHLQFTRAQTAAV